MTIIGIIGSITYLTLIGKAGFTGLISADHFSSASRSANTRSARLGVSLQFLSTTASGAQESACSLLGCFQGPDVSLCAVLPWSTDRKPSDSLQLLSLSKTWFEYKFVLVGGDAKLPAFKHLLSKLTAASTTASHNCRE